MFDLSTKKTSRMMFVVPAAGLTALSVLIVAAFVVSHISVDYPEGCSPIDSPSGSAGSGAVSSILVFSDDAGELLLCDTPTEVMSYQPRHHDGEPTIKIYRSNDSYQGMIKGNALVENNGLIELVQDGEGSASNQLTNIYTRGELGNVYDCYTEKGILKFVDPLDEPDFSVDDASWLTEFEPGEIYSCGLYLEIDYLVDEE